MTKDEKLEIDVLAGIIRFDEKKYSWLDELNKDDFTNGSHQALLLFLKDNKELTQDDLFLKLTIDPMMRNYDFQELSEYIEDQLHLSKTGDYSIGQLRLNSRFRKITKAIGNINKECPTAEQLDALMDFVSQTDTNTIGSYQTVPDAVVSVARDFINKDGRPKQALLSGWKEFDDLVGGFRKGVYIIGGLPGTGKTTLTLQVLIMFALNNPDKLVILHSLEMALEDLRFKVASYITGIASNKLEAFSLSPLEQKLFSSETQDMPENMILSFSGNLSAKEMEIKNNKYMDEYGKDIGLCALDYIQIASPNSKKDMDETKKIQAIAHEIRSLALTSYPIIALTQFTKDVERGQKPTMRSIKGSGQIAQDAICIIMLYSKEFAQVTISIEKNRFGMAGIEDDFDFLMNKSKIQAKNQSTVSDDLNAL